METLRGLDDLDCHEDLDIVGAGGRRALLQWRPASRHPGEACAIPPSGGGGWRQDLGELPELLGLGDDAVTWHSETEAWHGG